jgi:hypothetical protein
MLFSFIRSPIWKIERTIIFSVYYCACMVHHDHHNNTFLVLAKAHILINSINNYLSILLFRSLIARTSLSCSLGCVLLTAVYSPWLCFSSPSTVLSLSGCASVTNVCLCYSSECLSFATLPSVCLANSCVPTASD